MWAPWNWRIWCLCLWVVDYPFYHPPFPQLGWIQMQTKGTLYSHLSLLHLFILTTSLLCFQSRKKVLSWNIDSRLPTIDAAWTAELLWAALCLFTPQIPYRCQPRMTFTSVAFNWPWKSSDIKCQYNFNSRESKRSPRLEYSANEKKNPKRLCFGVSQSWHYERGETTKALYYSFRAC